jgi:hypothetical protein
MFSKPVYELDISHEFSNLAAQLDDELTSHDSFRFYSGSYDISPKIDAVHNWCLDSSVPTNYKVGNEMILFLHKLEIYDFTLPSDFLLFLIKPDLVFGA